MPVRKFRSVADMPGPPPGPPLDPDNLRRAFDLMDFGYRLYPMPYVPGVRKFRSVGEERQHRDEWETMQIRKRLREPQD